MPTMADRTHSLSEAAHPRPRGGAILLPLLWRLAYSFFEGAE
jgi:hypothetical protein